MYVLEAVGGVIQGGRAGLQGGGVGDQGAVEAREDLEGEEQGDPCRGQGHILESAGEAARHGGDHQGADEGREGDEREEQGVARRRTIASEGQAGYQHRQEGGGGAEQRGDARAIHEKLARAQKR